MIETHQPENGTCLLNTLNTLNHANRGRQMYQNGPSPGRGRRDYYQNRLRNCSGVGQTSGLTAHGASGSVVSGMGKLRARGPANRQTGGLTHA